MNILVIVAHPDDEVLGMGGTINKHAKNGENIRVVYLSTGITSRRNSGYKNSDSYEVDKITDLKMQKEIDLLKKHTKNSCRILGIKSYNFYNLPDNELDSIPRLKIIKIIEKEISNFKPDIIYTNHYGDLNIDHRLVFESCLTACRPLKKKTPKLISFGVISSMEWNYPQSFNPNYFVNISLTFKNKLRAMKEFKNELQKTPHPRSINGIEITAKKWGSVCGKNFAEAFEIIRIIDE